MGRSVPLDFFLKDFSSFSLIHKEEVKKMIEFRSVQKIYKDDNHVAIKEASFKIERGEFVFFVGPSGAGKSSLLKMVYKEEMPTNGQLLVFGRDTKKIKTTHLRRRVGVVFQDFELLKKKTAYENVAYALECLGESPLKIKKRAMAALEKMGIAEHADRYPHQMSGGQQQRIVIARAIVNEPEIIVCDEPTGNLDPESADIVMKYLEDLNASGGTILMSTHNTQIVEKMNKRVIYVEDGVAKSTPKENENSPE